MIIAARTPALADKPALGGGGVKCLLSEQVQKSICYFYLFIYLFAIYAIAKNHLAPMTIVHFYFVLSVAVVLVVVA